MAGSGNSIQSGFVQSRNRPIGSTDLKRGSNSQEERVGDRTEKQRGPEWYEKEDNNQDSIARVS